MSGCAFQSPAFLFRLFCFDFSLTDMLLALFRFCLLFRTLN